MLRSERHVLAGCVVIFAAMVAYVAMTGLLFKLAWNLVLIDAMGVNLQPITWMTGVLAAMTLGILAAFLRSK